ncbi:MAG: xanthine dehydrogenase family protein [Nitrososphaerota archaeon]|nr:xanthine dehydrogenase family protein [Nitrososphaerota archaeon]
MATVTELVKEERKLWMGQPLKRKEDPRLISGLGKYVDDVKLPGIAYAAILRSPYAHAKITRLETSRAERLPGVVCVMTGEEVAKLTDPFIQISPPPASKLKDYCLAVGKVHFVGEPVAAVVAETRGIAEDALELIEAEYETLDALVDARKGIEPSAPIIHEDAGTNIAFHGVWDYGDVEKAIKSADKVVRATLHFHRFSSTPIENNGVVANYDRATGFLNIYCNNQMPMFCIPWLSFGLRFPSNKIRMITGDIGGGFGTKIINYPYLALISLLSMKAKRPVKWTEDRREHLIANHGNERTFDVEVPIKNDGTILGLKARAFDDCGAYTRYEPAGATIWAQVVPGCLNIKDFRMDFYQVITNKAPVGPNRGYSRMQHLWMIERAIDLVANELGLNPADVRLKNYIQPDQMPYTTPSGGIYDGGDYPEALKKALKLIDYDGLREEQAKARKQGRLIGIGMGMAVDSGTNNFAQVKILTNDNPFSGNSEAARISIDGLGQIQVALGTVPQGQGHETFASQIVADEFGVTPDQVTVLMGFDSAMNPYSHQSGSYASRSAVMGTGALLGASKKLKDKVTKIAAHLMQTSPDRLEFKEGNVVEAESGKKVPLWQIGNVAWVNNLLLPEGMEPGLVALHYYKPPSFTVPDEKFRLNQTLTYSYQAHAVAVDLDPETGKFKILRYAIVDDCGRQINPLIVEGQVLGAAAHGIGGAMFENFEYDEQGQLLASTFVDYLVPTALDIPHIVTSHMEVPSLFAPKGIRGVGEGGGTPLGAISNAVEDALAPYGVRITDSHQNPQHIHKLIRQRVSKH